MCAEPWVSETKSMVPLKPTRAASHRDAPRTTGRSALQRRCDLEAAAKGQQTKSKDGGNHKPPIRGPIGGGRLSVHIHGLASGAAGVCMIRPTTSPAGRAAVLLNYVLRPADFIGHCNLRLSLSAGDEFRTSKKHRLPLKTSGLRTRTAPLVHVLICRMNPSHHGSDEQVFGAKRQVLRGVRARFANERRRNPG